MVMTGCTYHPDLPGINLHGRVWVIPDRSGEFTDEEVADIVDRQAGAEQRIHIVGHPDYTYRRVFGDDHELLSDLDVARPMQGSNSF